MYLSHGKGVLRYLQCEGTSWTKACNVRIIVIFILHVSDGYMILAQYLFTNQHSRSDVVSVMLATITGQEM